MALNKSSFAVAYLRNVCEDCYRTIVEEDIRWLEESDGQIALQPLEQLVIYQRFREEAVETLHWWDWEAVHTAFDETYKKVVESHKLDAMVHC